MIIGCDVDDTISMMMESWLRLYNRDFLDDLQKEQITDWDISKFVKPEAKQKIYQYINEPQVFSVAQPVKDALESINMLKSRGHRVIYVTANSPLGIKEQWLKGYGFLDTMENFYLAYDKSLILCDYLIDDKYENVETAHGKGILVSQPWNQKYDWKLRANNWKEILDIIL